MSEKYTPKVLDIIQDDILRRNIDSPLYCVCKEVSREEMESEEFRHFILDLVETMKYHKALGIAANQVGVQKRVMVIRRENNNPLVIMNPTIVAHSNEKINLAEGCLSYPGLYANIKRPRIVTVKYNQYSNSTILLESITTFAIGESRIIQHEMDHLDGKVFLDHASRYHRDKALKNYGR